MQIMQMQGVDQLTRVTLCHGAFICKNSSLLLVTPNLVINPSTASCPNAARFSIFKTSTDFDSQLLSAPVLQLNTDPMSQPLAPPAVL